MNINFDVRELQGMHSESKQPAKNASVVKCSISSYFLDLRVEPAAKKETTASFNTTGLMFRLAYFRSRQP